jgi:tyrosine-protein kinase Etk/Wzc
MNEMEFNLWKFLEVIALRIKFILVFILAAVIISIAVSLLLPKWYQASTLLLPPKDEGMQLGQSRGMEDMISITAGLTLPTRATPSDVYARILRSRNIAERVVAVNNLKEYYNQNSIIDLFEKISRQSDFRVTEEGLLEIIYRDKNPVMAAKIANSFAEELDKMNRELSTSRARITREFITNRLSEVACDLDSARVALREFQAQYRAVDLDQQTRLAIESAVNLKVALATNEIDLKVKEKSLSETHPDVINLQRKIEETKSQISSLEYGAGDSSYLSLPVSQVPALRIRLAELTSRLKVSETLFQILSEQLEQTKIQEKMDTPTLSILDKAYAPELAYRPQKRIIVMISTGAAFILAIFLALFLHYLDGLKKSAPEDYSRAQYFFRVIFGWIPGLGKK